MSTQNLNTQSELTIIIPAKNGQAYFKSATSLTKQDYSKMLSTRVLVADANSPTAL